MAEERINRKLAAILAADVVGYSRLMGADEAGTLNALKRHRETVFDPAVAAHHGRIVKLIGDGTIVEFPSVVDAVNCALSIQRSATLPPDQNGAPSIIVLRIGINLGDVIIEADDIYGDGVNIAARLEPVAEPGGICISSIVNESIGNRVDVQFRDGGEVSVKNIDRPIRIWRWHPNMASKRRGGDPATRRHRPEPKPATASIAILPFTNMSGDPEQEYFSDGISEDIITDLSKICRPDCDRPQFELHLQGTRGRRPHRRARTRRRFGARRLDPPRRPARAHHRAAHRRGERGASVGRPLRPRSDRYF